jgi:hypothetical protein
MQVRFPHSAGLDVDKASVVANVIPGRDEKGNRTYESKCFGTMTRDLLQLANWLLAHWVTHVSITHVSITQRVPDSERSNTRQRPRWLWSGYRVASARRQRLTGRP